MTEENKATIFVGCLLALLFASFLAIAIFNTTFKQHIVESQDIEFDEPPTEALEPEYGAVSINWDGTHWVIAKSTWYAMTGVDDA